MLQVYHAKDEGTGEMHRLCTVSKQSKQHKGRKASQQEKSWRTELNLPSKEFEKVVSITDLLYSKINNKKLFSQKTL